jgi:beta-1,4-mannosyltransferase
MKRIYLFPKVFPAENPYIINLENSLSRHYEIVNKRTNSSGVLDLFLYLIQADIYYFNWIENLPSRRFGKIQIIFFVFFLSIARLLRKKIVWTLHNKYSHDKTDNKWVDFMFRIMYKNSDFILTHSQSGIEYTIEKYPGYSSKIKYFIHPVIRVHPENPDQEYVYDLFIWGTIWFYKGIIEFLKYMKESRNTHLKILIAGKCIDENVKTEIDKYLTANCVHLDKFYGIDDIARFAVQSRFTLFTYNSESLLSSGSLMDSIGMGSAIIGPNAGAFRDLKTYSFIKTYNLIEEIPGIYAKSDIDKDLLRQDIEKFCSENNWDLFGEKLNEALVYYLKGK